MAEMQPIPFSSQPRRRRRRLGDILVDARAVTAEQLQEALKRQGSDRGRVGRILVELGFATDVQIAEALATQLHIPAADLVAVDVPADVLGLVDRELAFKHACLPWFVESRELFLIMADPTDVAAADAVAFHTGLKVKPVVAPESEVRAALERLYAAEETSLAQFEGVALAEQLSLVTEKEIEAAEGLEPAAGSTDTPVVRLVNAILADAIRCGASDVHVEPHGKGVGLRYRVDGLLRSVMTMPRRIQARLVSRIKIMAQMDISERRQPQDGRTFVRVAGRTYDLRISTLPTTDGEKVVIRVLAQAQEGADFAELGLDETTTEALRELLGRPQGLILVTGPTGSGKTSTLYAALRALVTEALNVVTIEDPVEYKLAGISQVAMSAKTGLTFAAGLRSVLRQDPDVVMVGEIRDLETAETVFQAAQTGHLVLSTLHANDAPSSVMRLVEMGIPAYVVASSLIGVMAQRLVRRLCVCRRAAPAGAVPVGCEACRSTGYRGRIGVYELMRMSPRVRSTIMAREGEDALHAAARASGLVSMFEDGMVKARLGLTTVQEVARMVPRDEVPEATQEPSAPPVVRAPSILVVEDDAPLADAIKDTLEAEHYAVRWAGDGRAALDALYREPPDLVLSDIAMPEMDGLELLRHIRHDLSLCRIPVVFLTADATPATEIRALDLGADDYLAKPVEHTKLLGRIRRALVRSRMAVPV